MAKDVFYQARNEKIFMTEHAFPLTSVYKGWDGYQQHLVHTLAPLSTEQLALRAALHLRSVGIVATHIIGAKKVNTAKLDT